MTSKTQFMPRRRLYVLLAALTAALACIIALAAAGTAHASTTYTATTSLTNRPDSGNNTDNGGNWAVDNMTRSSVLTDNGPSATEGLEDYTLVITDSGSFTTDAAASNPNGTNPSALIANQPISGSITGSDTFTFEAPSSAIPNSGGVPATADGSADPTSSWPSLFFAAGTALTSMNEGPWGWSYYTPQTCESWADTSANGAGAGSGDGGISGVGQCAVSVTNPGTQVTHVGSGASLQVLASTASSDKALTYSATGLPGGLTISSSTGVISGIPLTVENTDIVKVTATDAYGASSHVFFAWDTTSALVPDVLSLKYVCGFGHPRNNAELTVVSGSYVAHVNLVAVLWGGKTAGDGSVVVAPGHPIRVSALNSVAIRGYYNANGAQPPASNAGAFFIFTRIPLNGAGGRAC